MFVQAKSATNTQKRTWIPLYPTHVGVVRRFSICARFAAICACFAAFCAHFAGFQLWPKKTSVFNILKNARFIKHIKKRSFHQKTLRNSKKCSFPWFARKMVSAPDRSQPVVRLLEPTILKLSPLKPPKTVSRCALLCLRLVFCWHANELRGVSFLEGPCFAYSKLSKSEWQTQEPRSTHWSIQESGRRRVLVKVIGVTCHLSDGLDSGPKHAETSREGCLTFLSFHLLLFHCGFQLVTQVVIGCLLWCMQPIHTKQSFYRQETLFALFDFSRFRLFARLVSPKRFSRFSNFRVFAFARVTCELTAANHLSNFRVFALSRPTCTQETLQLFEFLGFRAAPGRLRVGNDTKK